MTDAAVVADLGAHVPVQPSSALTARMVTAMIARVRTEVPAYAGSADQDPCPMLEVAAREAIGAFFDDGPGRASRRRKVDDLFRRIGHSAAHQGGDPAPLVTALRVASRCAWDHISDVAVAQQHSIAHFRDVSSSMMEYADHLRDQLLAGHELGSRFTSPNRATARTRLWDFIMHSSVGRISPLRPLGMDHDELHRAAEAAEWPLPDHVVALAVSFHGDPPPLPESPEFLSHFGQDRLFVLSPAEGADALADHFTRSGTDRRVASSWPVRPEEAGTSLLWTARALDLVRLGVIAPTQIVRCTDHVTQLWLHAEPAMRQRLCQDLLKPLLAETPNSREILSDTLLAWLETRDSAPAIAARLDVHPQTVRYRWKRINELFGESLHDPEFVLQMTMVLKTSLPMWKAGNQSDFERFRDQNLAGP